MTTTDLKIAHADWLYTFRALQKYTADFSEPMQGKTVDWFVSGPLVTKSWVRNAQWAKSFIHKKHHAKLVPGIQYGAAFSHYQLSVLDRLTPHIYACWKMAAFIQSEIEKMENQ